MSIFDIHKNEGTNKDLDRYLAIKSWLDNPENAIFYTCIHNDMYAAVKDDIPYDICENGVTVKYGVMLKRNLPDYINILSADSITMKSWCKSVQGFPNKVGELNVYSNIRDVSVINSIFPTGRLNISCSCEGNLILSNTMFVSVEYALINNITINGHVYGIYTRSCSQLEHIDGVPRTCRVIANRCRSLKSIKGQINMSLINIKNCPNAELIYE